MDFPYKLILAPMEGVTHPMMREHIAQLGGLDLLCTEFIRISTTRPSAKALRKQIVKFEQVPLSVQLMGNKADLMADSAKIMLECGADIIDVNMGCPTKRAVRGGVGSAMLKDPKLCYKVMKSLREVVPGKLSAKIRAGFENDEGVFEILQALEDAGVDFIAVHPRKRIDHYKGHSDWRIISALKEKSRLPIIGNGDVKTATDCQSMFEQTQCDGVMIGRGALSNPWIFLQSQQLHKNSDIFLPTVQDIYKFHQELIEKFSLLCTNEQGTLNKTKEMLMYFSLNLPEPGSFRKEIGRSASVDEILNKLKHYLDLHQDLCGKTICGLDKNEI